MTHLTKNSSMLKKITFHGLASRERLRQCHFYWLQESALVAGLVDCIIFRARVDGF